MEEKAERSAIGTSAAAVVESRELEETRSFGWRERRSTRDGQTFGGREFRTGFGEGRSPSTVEDDVGVAHGDDGRAMVET